MPTGAEVERMVVRLMGDGTSYQQMVQDAKTATNEMAQTAEKAARASARMTDRLREGAAVARSVETATERYTREVSQLERQLRTGAISQRTFDRAMKQSTDSYKQATDKLGPLSRSLKNVGTSMSFRVTAPIAGIGALAIKAGSDFESGFAGVRKTVNATEPELMAMRSGFQKLAGDIPVATRDLLAIGEAAGQLGIENQNILGFTKTIAQLAASTNLGAEEGAAVLAKFANITGMSQDKFSNLGSSIVALGNNFATTESDITNMAMRLAGAGKTVGLSVPQITGLSAALSSVGLEAEAGGTAFSQLLLKMSTSVATGGKELETFARVSGKSVGEFSELFRKDAAGALKTVLQGLKNLDQEGRIIAIQEMGADGARMTDAILRASGAVDVLGKALTLSETAFEENSALAKEAGERFKTFESQVTMLKNKIGILLGEAFEIMRPVLVDIAAKIESLTAWFRGLSDETKRTIILLTGIAAAAGPVLIIAGSLIGSLKSIIGVAALATKAVGLLGLSMKAALIGTGVGALIVGIGVLVEKTIGWEKVIKGIVSAWNSVGDAAENAGRAISDWLSTDEEEMQNQIRTLRGMNNAISNAAADRIEKQLAGERKARAEMQKGAASGAVGFGAVIAEKMRQKAATQAPVPTPTPSALAPVAISESEQKRMQAAMEAAEKLAESIGGVTDSLQMQVATFGMTATEADLYRLKMEGASEAQLEAARTAGKQLEALEENKKLMDKGKEVTEQYKTPLEKFSDRQKELDQLLGAGAISQQTYQAAVKESKKTLEEAEKQAAKDYIANFSVTGIDAVEAGSAEAIARLREFQANNMTIRPRVETPKPITQQVKTDNAGMKIKDGSIFVKNTDEQKNMEEMKDYLAQLVELQREQVKKEGITLIPAGLI